MEKEEETLIRSVQRTEKISPDRAIYMVFNEAEVEHYLEEHPKLKEKYILGNKRLFNIESLRRIDQDIVITWQDVKIVRQLIEKGVLDNPKVKVKMMLDKFKGDVKSYPQIRKEFAKYFDSIDEIDTYFGCDVNILKDNWSDEDVLSVLSRFENKGYWYSIFSPSSELRRILESNPKYKEKFLILNDTERGDVIINLDRYNEEDLAKISNTIDVFPTNEEISEDEYKKLLRYFQIDDRKHKYVLHFNSLKGKIPQEFIDYAIKNDIDITIDLPIKGRQYCSYTQYELKDFLAIKEKMAELISGIDPELSDFEKFSEVYRRICQNIVYDYPAAYPCTEQEKKYSEENHRGVQNLKNGLLYGKTVCAGYAVILRQALEELGIEAEYVSGKVLDKPISRKKYEKIKNTSRYEDKEIFEDDGKQVTLCESHGWVKVKIDGIWYNCDPTWDAPQIVRGNATKYCLISDERISKGAKGRTERVEISGQECKDNYPEDRLMKAFDRNHVHFGRVKVKKPTAVVREFLLDLKDGSKDIKRDMSRFLQKLKPQKRKQLSSGTGEKLTENAIPNAMDKYKVDNPIYFDNKIIEEKKETTREDEREL